MNIQIHCGLRGFIEHIAESLDTSVVVGIVFFSEYIVVIHHKRKRIGIARRLEWLCEMGSRFRHFVVIRIGNNSFITNERGGSVKLVMLCNRIVFGIIVGNVFNKITEIGF